MTLFDIAADNVMTSEEDKKFLQMQRENPTSCSMSGCDKVLAAVRGGCKGEDGRDASPPPASDLTKFPRA